MPKRGKNDFYEVPQLWALHRVRGQDQLVWGRQWMIQFLIYLEREWSRLLYWQLENRTDFANIPLGDISRDGGGPPRAPEGEPNHLYHGHVSHRTGVDVDIYYIGMDNMPSEGRHPKRPGYDAERTKDLGFAILKAGGKHIEKILLAGDDQELVRAMKLRALAINPAITWIADSMHNNHFHVRLVAKDPNR